MKYNYKTFGIISFIVSLLSPFIAMALIDTIGEVEIFDTAGMMRYSWIFWLFIPVVLTSYWFGRKLKELRIERGYTQIKMQMLTGIDQSDYSKIERGVRYYTFEQCVKIAKALNTSMDYLAGLTDVKDPYPPAK